jgi:trehalose-6-phosphate synthase
VKIKPEDVRTELEDDDDSIKKEVTELCNKYTIQTIFQKESTMYEYSDKALWNMILYQLEEEGSELVKEKEEEFNKEGEE